MEPDLVATVADTLAAHDLPVDALCLEITESMLMDESGRAATTIDELAELGIILSVDDFGTGYSSLLYLRRFPVHALKLDRSFVAGIGTSRVDTAIVGSMIDLARSLRLASVAEGVETAEQAEALRARGCDLAQGYHWSRPVPAEEFSALLADPRFQ
jgi:EAL domain-containing protein (putative c-di-GMP-specific phosphodiesterase class I)